MIRAHQGGAPRKRRFAGPGTSPKQQPSYPGIGEKDPESEQGIGVPFEQR
jgi:hypothetical protein